MTNVEKHLAVLQDLNRNYVRSVDEGDVAWFEANLAADFFNTNPDGGFIDREGFLAQVGRGSTQLRVWKVRLRSGAAWPRLLVRSMIAENHDFGEPTKRHRTHETSVFRADWRAAGP